MIAVTEMERRIEEMKKQHEAELKNIQNMARHQAVEFFMKKNEETSRRYTDHVLGILKEYDAVRLKNFNNEAMLMRMTKMVLRLEVLYSDMRTFTTQALNEVFNTVQKRESEIEEAMCTKLPGGVQHARTKRDDALALYCSYINLIRPVDIEENCQAHSEEIADMEQRLTLIQQQLEASEQVSEMFLDHEQDFKNQIRMLDLDKDNLKEELKQEKIKMDEEMQRLKEESQQEVEDCKMAFTQYKKLVEKEMDLLQLIATETAKDRGGLVE